MEWIVNDLSGRVKVPENQSSQRRRQAKVDRNEEKDEFLVFCEIEKMTLKEQKNQVQNMQTLKFERMMENRDSEGLWVEHSRVQVLDSKMIGR